MAGYSLNQHCGLQTFVRTAMSRRWNISKVSGFSGRATGCTLAFSLPSPSRKRHLPEGHKPVIGLGVMSYAGMYGVEKTTESHYAAYIKTLVLFVEWLLERDYQVRLSIGDLSDMVTVWNCSRSWMPQIS